MIVQVIISENAHDVIMKEKAHGLGVEIDENWPEARRIAYIISLFDSVIDHLFDDEYTFTTTKK